jgi:hypothetical protein
VRHHVPQKIEQGRLRSPALSSGADSWDAGTRAPGSLLYAHSPERWRKSRPRERMLSFLGNVLSLGIPLILLAGVIWNPRGIEERVFTSLVAVLVVVRLGIAIARMKAV